MSSSHKVCQTCRSVRLVKVIAKTSEFCMIELWGQRHVGSVPHDMNIGNEEYLEFQYCLHCGQLQGEFPLPTTALEQQLAATPR